MTLQSELFPAPDTDLVSITSQPRLFKATGARVLPNVEWVEIQVKSVLNRVQGMPFKWSINPYRGCQHQCTFCMWPETRVLMGDGTHKPIAELRAGDTIYGTMRDGFYRRYVRTTVMAHWFTQKPAFRIFLEDGTSIVASGDHRLLSERGWKYVTGTEYGRERRPFLTLNNKLMGVGRFTPQPQKNSDYMRGYLAGLIHGDGCLTTYSQARPGHRHSIVHQFRLALTDTEALRRAESYLREYDIPTRAFLFSGPTAQHRAVHAIRAQTRSLVEAVRFLVDWPGVPPEDWWKGFLAGIFDAEGGHEHGVIRIANTDEVILDHVRRGLTRLGFHHVTEVHARSCEGRLKYVRVRGGLPETIRFFHTVAPAISRKRDIEGRAVKSGAALRVVSIEPLSREVELVDITTGTGDFIANGVISHNCYARRTHWFLDQDGVNGWGSRIFVKINAPEVLRRELEPDVPPPIKRLEALRSLAQAGVPVAVLLAPVLPGITDHPKQLAAVVEAAKEYGASSLWTNALHLGDVTRQAFFQYLEQRRPELIPQYERLYRGKYAPSSYRRHVQEIVAVLKAKHGFRAPRADSRPNQKEIGRASCRERT